MAKIQPIPPVPSYWDWMAMFRVMADPQAYAQKLEELEKLRDEINAQIQVRESASQLESIKAEETLALQAAKDELAKAKAEGVRLLAEAAAEVEDMRLEATAQRETSIAQMNELRARLDRKQAELEATAKSTQELADRSQRALAEAQDSKRKSEAIRIEFEAKVAKLKGALA